MPNQESVNLNVKFGPQPGQGWTEVIAANGQVYAFKYSGGANNNGGLETQVGQGTATINVSLSTDNRYSISDVVFTGDGNNQLTRSIGSSSAATITDINTVAETADYCVVVADSVGNTTILCDPMIKNDPKTPMAMMAQPRIVHS